MRAACTVVDDRDKGRRGMATSVGANLGFVQGLKDGYPLYAMVKRPEVPDRAPASYGVGMVGGGLTGLAAGIAPLAGYYFFINRKNARVSPIMKNVMLGGAAVWAFLHIPAGIAAAFQGARIVATSTGTSVQLPDRLPTPPQGRSTGAQVAASLGAAAVVGAATRLSGASWRTAALGAVVGGLAYAFGPDAIRQGGAPDFPVTLM